MLDGTWGDGFRSGLIAAIIIYHALKWLGEWARTRNAGQEQCPEKEN
jgi:hypothetical protein